MAEGSDGPLRRHGDVFERLGGGYYSAHGRSDDTMNLGGIKVGMPKTLQCHHLLPLSLQY